MTNYLYFNAIFAFVALASDTERLTLAEVAQLTSKIRFLSCTCTVMFLPTVPVTYLCFPGVEVEALTSLVHARVNVSVLVVEGLHDDVVGLKRDEV